MESTNQKNIRKIMILFSKPFIFLIKLYQWFLSPFVGQHCRFYPTCSSYMIEAIEEHMAPKGLLLGLKRLLKCHPWHEGGCDPVSQKHK